MDTKPSGREACESLTSEQGSWDMRALFFNSEDKNASPRPFARLEGSLSPSLQAASGLHPQKRARRRRVLARKPVGMAAPKKEETGY